MGLFRAPWRAALLVFAAVFVYVGWIAASRVFLGDNDEGIYLTGALRMLRGEVPYLDFFVLTGPGSFALQAASLKLFGISLWAARLPLIFDLATMTACLFWLVSRLSGRFAAALASFAFLAFEMAWQSMLANHRWDSSAWAFLAATLLFFAVESPAGPAPILASLVAGLAAAMAAWCTPPVAIAGLALAACLARPGRVRMLIAYLGGLATAFLAGAIALAASGALLPLIRSLGWTVAHYSAVNRAPFAWVIGGYANLFRGSSLAQAGLTIALLIFLTLPATLPFFSLIWLRKQPSPGIIVLMAASAALILSTYPRWDMLHLVYVAAPAYALAAPLIASWRFVRPVAVTTLLAAASLAGIALDQRLSEPSRQTMLGMVHGPPADLETMEMLQSHVHPSDTLFVYPYRPLAYFLTLARNPTRYSFLQPGMFPESDETLALEELEAQPPRWVFYMDLSPDQFLRIWPASDPRRLRMPRIESFLKSNYQKVEESGGFELLERQGAANAGLPQ